MTTRMSRLDSRPARSRLKCSAVAPNPADDDRDTQPKQARADDRSGDLRPDHVRLAPGQDEDREDEFGHAAEADVQQPADRLTHARGHVLGRAPHPVGQHGYGRGARQEHGDGRAAGQEFQCRRDREREQKQERQLKGEIAPAPGIIGRRPAVSTRLSTSGALQRWAAPQCCKVCQIASSAPSWVGAGKAQVGGGFPELLARLSAEFAERLYRSIAARAPPAHGAVSGRFPPDDKKPLSSAAAARCV